MPATHLVHPMMWLPYVRKNRNYAALRYPFSHTLNICLSRTPHNCVLIKCGPRASEFRLTVTFNKCSWIILSLCLQAMAILRPLLAYKQSPEAHYLHCKAMFDLLTAVTWGFKNSGSLVNSARRLEGSYDTHTHTHTHTQTHTHTNTHAHARAHAHNKRQANVYLRHAMYEDKLHNMNTALQICRWVLSATTKSIEDCRRHVNVYVLSVYSVRPLESLKHGFTTDIYIYMCDY